jgi:uncharacterized membrane protein YhaH (DUF805 family)
MTKFIKSMETAVADAYVRAFDFRGTSTFKQFWFFFLFQLIVQVLVQGLLYLIALAIGGSELLVLIATIFLIAHLVLIVFPYIAVAVRRLRDTGFSSSFASLMLLNIFAIWDETRFVALIANGIILLLCLFPRDFYVKI